MNVYIYIYEKRNLGTKEYRKFAFELFVNLEWTRNLLLQRLLFHKAWNFSIQQIRRQPNGKIFVGKYEK